MTKPSLPEIALYFHRAGLPHAQCATMAEKFYLHHEAKGWRIGKQQMKNWRAACATWLRNLKRFESERARNLSAPRELPSGKTETDETAYRVTINGRLFEFDRATEPPVGTALWLSWNNWRACPEACRKNV